MDTKEIMDIMKDVKDTGRPLTKESEITETCPPFNAEKYERSIIEIVQKAIHDKKIMIPERNVICQ